MLNDNNDIYYNHDKINSNSYNNSILIIQSQFLIIVIIMMMIDVYSNNS